ncbi:MAG: histidine phosphatase family protein [Bifidobacteriaceae bacterium]|jgi:broad specificity phosphatase PhoE|nr:histidine phosphatase family protein [Bifidobacteriaceae bacterium]
MAEPLTTIHLVRHGEVHNPAGVLYERLPGFHLSDNGQAMAQVVADHLATRHAGQIDALVASPLERAQETAAPIAQALGLEVRTDPRVIEAQNSFAGQKVDLPNLLKPRAAVRLANPWRPSWGEPFKQIAARMHAAMADLRAEFPGGQVVVVSHQSPIWRAVRQALGEKLWKLARSRDCSLASVTSLTYDADQLASFAYAEPAAHLLPAHLR